MKPIVVIYHRADFDGLFSREIARKAFRDDAEYIGWDYNDPVPEITSDVVTLLMIDISIDSLMNHPGLIWIDHHQSAIEKHGAKNGYQINGVAACRLAYQWLFRKDPPLPDKIDFVNRLVAEPTPIRLAGEYDVFDRRDGDAEIFQHGLRSRELTPETWDRLISFDNYDLTQELLRAGRMLHYAKTEENASIAKASAFTFWWEDLCFCAINAARYNSHLFTAAIKPEHDALFGFNFDGKQWRVSMYGVPGKPDVDLAKIAVKYGGGGHRQACGFRTEKLPFL